MSIIRVLKNKKNPYFMMNKTGINDPRLSLKSKGLLAYLISKPDGWYINYQDIIKNSNNSVYSIRSAVKELLHFGYMVRTQIRSENGRFGYYDYTVYERPQAINLRKNRPPPVIGFPHAVNPLTEKRILLSNDFKNIISTTTTFSGNIPVKLKPAADDSATLEKKNSIIEIFKSLNIKSHLKIFEEFPVDKILLYSEWLKNRKSKMSNPTGFLITALRENWIDYEKDPQVKKTPRWWAYCFPCRKDHQYFSEVKKECICKKCNKPIPFIEHERF